MLATTPYFAKLHNLHAKRGVVFSKPTRHWRGLCIYAEIFGCPQSWLAQPKAGSREAHSCVLTTKAKTMKTSKTLVALAVAGLIGGLAVDQAYAGDTAGHDAKTEADKNSCKGKSGCNGKGSCSACSLTCVTVR